MSNVSPSITRILNSPALRPLTNPTHPLSLLSTRVAHLLAPKQVFSNLPPIVSAHANFDSLLIPKSHPSRLTSDTYYVDSNTVLRTHTSAHQSHLLSSGHADFVVVGDVYRRDQIDRTHYPVFHQMEGVRTFSYSQVDAMEDLRVEYTETEANPIQIAHRVALSNEQSRKLIGHLQATLLNMIKALFRRPDLQHRWVPAYFPFTSPSFELEIFFQDEWLECLGCGVIEQQILNDNTQSERVGWAFGLGLERLAMVLFGIPDIRLFWTQDSRFLSQFMHLDPLDITDAGIVTFQPYSKFPSCYKDISFYVSPPPSPGADNAAKGIYHENDFNDLLRTIAGDLVEDVKLIDDFTHPKSRKRSWCFRIMFRHHERSLTNEEVNRVIELVVAELHKADVEVR